MAEPGAGPPVPATVPVLPVSDLDRSLAFYGRLGFTLRAAYEGYAVLGFQGAELHLAQMDEVAGTPSLSGAYLRVADAAGVHAAWLAVGAREVAPLADQTYGIREFATEDLDGNLWRVGSPVPDGPLDGWVPEDRPVVPVGRPTTTMDPDPDPDPVPAGPDGPAGEAAPPDHDPTASDDRRSDGGPGTGGEHWVAIVAGDDRCAGCGKRSADLPSRALGAEIREEVHAFGLLLEASDDDALRRRPADASWSALEYAVHVRDVLRVFGDRVVLTLRQDEPELGWWDHEAAIADGLANESDVGAVVDDLARNSSQLSEALRAVTDDDWDRGATRRSDERFTIDLLGRFALHEVVHHHVDAQRALAATT